MSFNKLTPQVRNHINELVASLPQVPFVQKDVNGKLFAPKMKKGERINPKLEGNRISFQVQTTVMQRMVNHKVNLLNAFNKGGMMGIDMYVQSVNEFKTYIDEINKPKQSDDVKTSSGMQEVSVDAATLHPTV